MEQCKFMNIYVPRCMKPVLYNVQRIENPLRKIVFAHN